jgi:hypothetical protein
MKKTTLLLTAVFMALSAASAMACPNMKKPCHEMEKPCPYAQKAQSNSQKLTVEQLSAIQTDIEFNMKRIDLNGNKAIDKEEFSPAKAEKLFGAYATDFKALDTNKNGNINSQELMNAKLNYDVTYYERAVAAPTNN